MINKEEVIREFSLQKTGNKGWLFAPGLECPYCHHKDHISFILNDQISSFSCRHCYAKGTLITLFTKINRLDLISPFFRTVKRKIENKFLKKEEEFILETETKPFPIGFIKVYEDDYLNKRGFTLEHYNNYVIGISNTHFILKQDYIIFVVIENNECKGYVARSKKSKEEIKKLNEERKLKGLPKYLRWKNSNADFSKLIFGIDEIKEGKTHTMILVEGITSKANVDKILNLFKNEEIKCGATFGKILQDVQMLKLKAKGIKNIILLYDPDAIEYSKEYSLKAEEYFNVKVGFLKEKDPGELNEQELIEILSNLQNPLKFGLSKLAKKELC
jgi:Zn ribbon nucleic-acid-binding protein